MTRTHERGSALIGVLLLLLMMSALAAVLSVSGRTETLIARNHQSSAQARAAAEAGLNHAVQVAIDYLRGIDPDTIPGVLDTLLADTSALTGVSFATETWITGATDTKARYEVFLMDEDDPDRGDPTTVNGAEDGDALTDNNSTLVVRAVGYAGGNTSVVLEALIKPIELGAIVTDGDLDISGSVEVTGGVNPEDADVHANGDLTISGSTTIAGDMTASGEYDGPEEGSGGQPEKPLPKIRAGDYKDYADYVLSDVGLIECNVSGGCAGGVPFEGTVCDPGPSGKDCDGTYGWEFDGPGEWSIKTAGTENATFYIEGAATISSTPVLTITIIAEGSIKMSGNPVLTADTNELLFVTDGDLDISGGATTNVNAQGQMLVHEQISISGNTTLGGQLIVEDSPSEDPLVENNSITGNVTINYDGTLGTNLFFVTGWREIR